MTYVVIALQFLVVFAVNFCFLRKLVQQDVMTSGAGWAVLGGTISAVIGLVSCVCADALGVSVSSSMVTVFLGCVGGIAAVIFWDVFLARAFKNLHQLT